MKIYLLVDTINRGKRLIGRNCEGCTGKVQKQKSHSFLSGFCSPSWARTRDPLINSQVL
jgi:hypothetical protein